MPNRLGWLLAMSLSVTSMAKERAHDGSYRFTVGSYNVENFWDQVSDNTPRAWEQFLNTLPEDTRQNVENQSIQYDDYSIEKSNWYEPGIFANKIKNVTKAIELAGSPDILGMQEFESAGNTADLFAASGDGVTTFKDALNKLGYKYFYTGLQEEDNPVSVTTAFASKLPLKVLPSVVINNNYSISSRDIQVVELQEKDARLIIFNGHWKSKAGAHTEEERVKTARLVKQRIQEEKAKDPEVNIIVLGDLNTAYYEKPMQELGATGDERVMLSRHTPSLYNLWYELPENKRWEESYNGTYGNLSDMIISDGFYNESGFLYTDHSFHIVGQEGEAAKVLLNNEGIPFRWQTGKRKGKTIHYGKGYSDHLPLVAEFSYVPVKESKEAGKRVIDNPSTETVLRAPQLVLFPKVVKCALEEAVDVEKLDFSKAENLDGRCVKIEVPSTQAALPLLPLGSYGADFVKVSGRNIGLVMNRAFDWRPNTNDSRVTMAETQIAPGAFDENHPHPHSNKCFSRKVLQGAGGALRMAVGRLGYDEGELKVFIASREKDSLVLENLPAVKLQACKW